MYVCEQAEEGTRLVLEVARETGIHDTPISRSAAALSGVHTAADASEPRLHIGLVITEARSWTIPLDSLCLAPLCTPFLRLGLVRTCHAATCARQTQRGSYMAKAPLILHATRGRADAFCTRAARKRTRRSRGVPPRVWVSFPFFLCIIEPRDQLARSFALAAAWRAVTNAPLNSH